MGFKDVMKGIGKVALKAAPIAAGFIPGVGGIASKAISAGTNALSKKLDGGSWKDTALAGVQGAMSGGKQGGLGPSTGKLATLGNIGKGLLGSMSGGGGQQQQQQPQQQQQQPQQPMQRPGQMGQRGGMGQRNGMMRAGGTAGRMGGAQGGSPGMGPSFGNDLSGQINRMNPTGNPDMAFAQGGRTGGYLDGVGETIGQGRSTTPALAKQQMLQAERQGVPASFIQDFLKRNPGDTNRLIEGYGAENPNFQGGSWQNYAMPSEEEANASPWGQQNINVQGYDSVYGANPQFGGQGGLGPSPQFGGGRRGMPRMGNMPVGGGNQDPYTTGGMENMPQMIPGGSGMNGTGGQMPPNWQTMMGGGNQFRTPPFMPQRSATQGRMGMR